MRCAHSSISAPRPSLSQEGATKQSSITVERTFRREKPVKYVITDVTPDRRSKDWERVVAVFVMGQFWQFKDWPHEGIKNESLVEAFTRVRGFFLRYTTDPPNTTVKTWNVKTLSIPRDARHGDKCAGPQRARPGKPRAASLPMLLSGGVAVQQRA